MNPPKVATLSLPMGQLSKNTPAEVDPAGHRCGAQSFVTPSATGRPWNRLAKMELFIRYQWEKI